MSASARSPWITLLLAGVLSFKVALALTLAGHPLLQPDGDLDAGEYWRLAQRVSAGDVLLVGTPFHVSPLYIYWLAFAQAITGASVRGVLLLQAALGTLAVWLTARTAALWVPGGMRVRAAVVAGGALALTGIVALQEALILQSALDAVLMSAFAYACTRALQESSRPAWAWAWCGVALALLATNRPNAWLLGAIVAMCAWRSSGGAAWERQEEGTGLGEPALHTERPALPTTTPVLSSTTLGPASAIGGFEAVASVGRAGTARPYLHRCLATTAWALGALVVLMPFTMRTMVATGEWQVLPGHGGLNFYIGNHPGANGTYAVVESIRPSMAGQRQDMRQVAERAAGTTLSDAQVSRHFLQRALEWWRGSPAAASRLLAYKAWLATHAWELPVNVSYAWFREQVALLWLLPLGAWALIPVGLAASVAGPAMVPASRAGWRAFRWLLPTYLASVALFFVVDRYRAPALVLCAVHLGILASWVSDRDARASAMQGRAARLRGTLAISLALVLGAASLIPLPFQLGEAEADTWMAVHAIDAGQDDEAGTWLTRAVARHPAPGVAWLRAGLAWQARNDLERAERALREAYRLDRREAAVAFALGEVLISEGKGAEAVPLLEQAERGGVRPDRARLDLALARWQAGDQPSARATLAAGVPPEALPLLRARALASVEAGRADLAAWLLAEHRRYVGDDAEVAEKLGLMFARRGDTTAAAALFEQAAQLDVSRPTARFNLAIARVQQGRKHEAIALLREALRIDPSYAQAAGALRELLGTKQ